MSCCGKKRNEYAGSISRSSATYTHTPPGQLWSDVIFEYIGERGLTVKGAITGRTYRFNSTGDQQQVDYRDAGSMMAISLLRKISKET